jgi:hypothetical protein
MKHGMTREQMVEDLVGRAVDGMELADLIEYFEDRQKELFETLEDSRVQELYEEAFGDDNE